MEGQVTSRENFYRHLLMFAAGFGAWSAIGFGYAQEKSAAPRPG